MPTRQLATLPKFDTVEEERLHRKQRLAAAFRLFGSSASTRASPATSPPATPSTPTTSG